MNEIVYDSFFKPLDVDGNVWKYVNNESIVCYVSTKEVTFFKADEHVKKLFSLPLHDVHEFEKAFIFLWDEKVSWSSTKQSGGNDSSNYLYLFCESENDLTEVRRLLLDFIFEAVYGRQKLFLKNLKHLIFRSKLVQAILRKATYRWLMERSDELDFKEEEWKKIGKDWVKFCIDNQNHFIFSGSNSMLGTAEREVIDVLGRKRRRKHTDSLFESETNKEIITFFMRKYNIIEAFRFLGSKELTVLSVFFFIFYVTFLVVLIWKWCYFYYLYLFLPIIILVIVWLGRKSSLGTTGLLRLFFPRLVLGTLLGWVLLATAPEVIEFSTNNGMTLYVSAVSLIFLILIFFYFYVEILNYAGKQGALFKAVGMLLISVLLSGYLGLLTTPLFHLHLIKCKSCIACQLGSFRLKFSPVLVEFGSPFSTLIGAILQFLWEDRPITEPL